MKLSIKPTPNQYELWGTPVAIILHTTLGAFDGAVSWLRMTPEERLRRTGRKSYSSANAVIGRLGEIAELAGPDKGTWHAGGVSNPSKRAKAIIPRKLTGGIKNPNRYTFGIEFASGYDIDKDGVLESWEKLYSPQQIKACAEYILTRIEPEIKRIYGKDIEFNGSNIITHKDVTSYKPDLEIQRAMVLIELKKQREAQNGPVNPPEIDGVMITKGTRLKVESIDGDIIKMKIT